MKLLRRILEILLPTSCSFCHSPIGDSSIPFFCSSCWSDFSLVQGPVCPCCGKPFESPETLLHSPEHLCLACRRLPPQFDQALSVGYFEGALREAIHQFKYRPCRSLGSPLGTWMAGHIRTVDQIDLLIPIPLHKIRLRKRGFNQSLLLAHHVSGALNLRLSYDNLARTRPTRPQVELSGQDRIRNVRGAFAVTRPEEICGKSVLLVDDVFTTGATMNECATVLKNAGALRVTALTLARAF